MSSDVSVANKLVERFDLIESSIMQLKQKISIVTETYELDTKTKAFLISFSENSRDLIKQKLENVVNSALEYIFSDKKITFILNPKITKRGVEYELYAESNGSFMPLESAKGGGVLDVCSIALRIAFLRLFRTRLRQTMILDEPFKNLDVERLENAVKWLKTISDKFEIQFIIVSHEDSIINNSDKIYRFKLNGNEETIVS